MAPSIDGRERFALVVIEHVECVEAEAHCEMLFSSACLPSVDALRTEHVALVSVLPS